MLPLLQLLKTLNKNQRVLFFSLFSDLDCELNVDLVRTMLFDHFLIEIKDDEQLEKITDTILNKARFEICVNAVNSAL